MITKTADLTIRNGYSAILSSPIEVFCGDRIEVILHLYEVQVNVNVSKVSKSSRPVEIDMCGLTAEIIHQSPGNEDGVTGASVDFNTISFVLENIFTSDIGENKCQIRLKDNNGYKLTFPEFSYTVKESIDDNVIEEPPIYGDYATDEEVINAVNSSWNNI